MVTIKEMLVAQLVYAIVFYDKDYNEYYISHVDVSNGKIEMAYLPFEDNQTFKENVDLIDPLKSVIALAREIEFKLIEEIPSLNLKIKCFKYFKFPDTFYLSPLFEIKLKELVHYTIRPDRGKIYYDAIGNSVAKRFDTLDDAIEYLLLTVSDENMDGITIYEDNMEEEYEFREQ